MNEQKKAITSSAAQPQAPKARKHPAAITTNTIQPKPTPYPDEGKRRPAKGPMITTSNVDEIRTAGKKKGKKA